MPATLPVNVMVVIADAEQMVCVAGVATAFGVGLTVIVKVFAVPVEPAQLVTGVTIIVAVIGDVVALIAVKLSILPVPLAARPIDGVLFVQS